MANVGKKNPTNFLLITTLILVVAVLVVTVFWAPKLQPDGTLSRFGGQKKNADAADNPLPPESDTAVIDSLDD